MKIAICEDEKISLELFKTYCREWIRERGIKESKALDIIIGYSNAEAFLFDYEDQKDFDILLLDIQMKKLSGMDLAKRLRERKESVQIIFLTGKKEYVFDGYFVQAVDYLLKPVDKGRLFSALDRAFLNLKKEEPSYFIPVNGEIRRIKEREIFYIESQRHDTLIHLKEETLLCHKSISKWEKEVDTKQLILCHRSFLVSILHIESIGKSEVTLEDGIKIPIARGRWEEINQAYLTFFRQVFQ